MRLLKRIYWFLYLQYLILLARYLRGQLQPVVLLKKCLDEHLLILLLGGWIEPQSCKIVLR
ncbi:hypothetical protein [Staphylococcus borealis]|uniref:hypothetical protein n=1 Tax=Staphylococcus borealis TaxID=2742203 RepID=UPI0039E75E4E